MNRPAAANSPPILTPGTRFESTPWMGGGTVNIKGAGLLTYYAATLRRNLELLLNFLFV